MKKQILDGKMIREVECCLVELELITRKAIKDSTTLKQVFTTSMSENGVSFHSVNKIQISSMEIDYFNNCLLIVINENEFSIAINDNCNVLVQIPQSKDKLQLLFKDLQMTLIFQ